MPDLTIPADLSIPEFMRVANRDKLPAPTAALKPPPRQQPRQVKPRQRRWHDGHPLPRSIDAAGLELVREIEKRTRDKARARFAMLRERARR